MTAITSANRAISRAHSGHHHASSYIPDIKGRSTFVTSTDIYKIADQDEVSKHIKKVADLINKDFGNKETLVLIVSNHTNIFAQELVRHLRLENSAVFKISSHSSYDKQGRVKLDMKIGDEILNNAQGKDILIVDTLARGGYTIGNITKVLNAAKPKSISSAVLVDEASLRHRKYQNIKPKYSCFEIDDPNRHAIGVGIDYRNRFGNLPYLATVNKS